MSGKHFELADAYAAAVQNAASMGIAAEPEAQLTVPVERLFRDVAAEAGLGELTLVREAQLDGVRPDFAAAIDKKPCGWIELKAPGHTLDGNRWGGREKKQWELLAQLDSLIVSNGQGAVLYVDGDQVAKCHLPFDSADGWSADQLIELLQRFTLAKVTPIKRVSQLADRLAPLARFIRLRLNDGVKAKTPAVLEAMAAWNNTVHETTPEQFASDVAQVIAYSMTIAGLSGQADLNNDGTVNLKEAKETLEVAHRNVLAAALGPIIGIPELIDYIGPEIEAISRLVSSLDIPAIQSSKDPRGEPWLWFYEDFLAKYDPEARKQSGVYYTPTSVVQCQVRIVDDLLRNRFKQPLGFGAANVTTLDPATGSGTYPLAIIDHAVDTALIERGPAGPAQVAKNLTKNLMGFELLPGPYSVAHLRIGQRLAEAAGQMVQVNAILVYLTDTLDNPAEHTRSGLFGDAKVLAEAAEEARRVKANEQITVTLGNPPYDRVTADSGGWVMHGSAGQAPLFDDVIKPAQDAGVIFSAQASLYNMYVYFWRWAIWKTFQNDPKDKAIISFITASSWLEGSAFVGLRQLAVDTANEIWIIDLGGEGRGARREENIFNIQSPVAIVTLVRGGKSAKAAKVYYRRLRGTRQEKFTQLDKINQLSTSDNWVIVEAPNGQPFIPPDPDELWAQCTPLVDLFPWQQPGIKYNRMWPVAPSQTVLKRRWTELVKDTDLGARAERYVTATTGRGIYTRVGSLPPIAELSASSKHQPIARMGWRSFDRQWTFDDPRLANLERPALWQAVSDEQIYLISPTTTRIGAGPAATLSTEVPDLHYFRGSYGGKDVIPLYRDREAKQPNITAGLLVLLGEKLSLTIHPEDLLAYCFALIAHPGYTSTFWKQLEHAGVRVPITANATLFTEAMELGRRLIWLQTYGERLSGPGRPHGNVPRRTDLYWTKPVTSIPEDTKQIRYDSDTGKLSIGDGVVESVRPEVRAFEVSGMNVLDKWIGARTQKGIGRAAGKAATPLDKIRPDTWEDEWNDELLDLLRVLTESVELAQSQENLLDRIVAGGLIPSTSLPTPAIAQQKVPKTLKRGDDQLDLP